MTDADLRALLGASRSLTDHARALADAATAPTGGGSWVAEHNLRAEVFTGPLSDESRDIGQFDEPEDADFIAWSRMGVLDLAAAVRARDAALTAVLDREQTARTLMPVMGCEQINDTGECPNCGEGYCRGHGDFTYCQQHDEASEALGGPCPTALRAADAVIAAVVSALTGDTP